VSVAELQTSRDYWDFVNLPWRTPRDRQIVRPMRELQRQMFDRGRRFRKGFSVTATIDEALLGKENPFFEHGDLAGFLARDAAGRPIARIAAIVNNSHNEYHHDSLGFFGYFDSVDSGELGREATTALVDAASAWLRTRGKTAMRGPLNPTMNDECGVWTEGDTYPAFLIPSNPRYYADLLYSAGLEKAKTLHIYRLPVSAIPEEKWVRWSKRMDRMADTYKISLRGANFKDLDSEVKSMVEIYNVTECDNWNFQPMHFSELRSMAEIFQYLLDPNLIRVAETEENGVRKVIGGTITFPDVNEILRRSDGRLVHPTAIWKLLRMKMGRPTKRIRVAFLGVRPEYRHTPASMILLYDSFRVAREFGAQEFEGSWILEDNRAMVKPMEDWNMTLTDKYVIMEKPIG
jgi:hypothetical protein